MRRRSSPVGQCDPPTFIVKQIDIPSSVVTAFVNVRTAAIQVQVMQFQIQQRQAEAKGIEALNSALAVAGQNYVLIKAIESGKINFWVLPSGSGTGLTIAPGANGTPAAATTPAASTAPTGP